MIHFVLLRYAAAEAAGAITTYLANGVKLWLTHKASEWLEDLVDLAVAKLTGKSFSAWEKDGKTALSAALGMEQSIRGNRDLVDILIAEVLSSTHGQRLMAKWNDTLERVTGIRQAREEALIDQSIIPEDVTLIEWAKDVASRLGLDPNEVLARRLAL